MSKKETSPVVTTENELDPIVNINGEQFKMSDFIEPLPYHPIALEWPEVIGEQRAFIKASIQEKGVEEPLTKWCDDQGIWWIVDGRTRDSIVRELISSGINKTVKGDPIKLEYKVFEGTTEELVSFTTIKNAARRQMTKAQLAAMAVKLNIANNNLARNEKGKKRRPTEDLAKKIAEDYGVNRTFIFDCKNIFKEKPEYLNEIAKGKMSIGKAKTQISMINGAENNGDGEVEEGEEAKNGKPVVDEVVVDANKKPVPENLVEVFESVDEFSATVKMINALESKFKELCAEECGAYLSFDEIKRHLSTVRKIAQNERPHSVCPHCRGTGTFPKGSRKACPICKKTKFVSKTMWNVKDAIPEEVKNAYLNDLEPVDLAMLENQEENPGEVEGEPETETTRKGELVAAE